MNVDFTLVGGVISTVADVMTIVGIGGVLSWSFLKKDRSAFQRKVISIFALSVKTFVCLVLLGFIIIFGSVPHLFVLMLTTGTQDSSKLGGLLWNSNQSAGYIAAYVIEGLIVIPTYSIICACIYDWSLNPLTKFTRVFTNEHRNDEKLAGDWDWQGCKVATFLVDGKIASSTGETATWRWINARKLRIHWSTGPIDIMRISENFEHLEGTNQQGDKVKATKLPAQRG